MYVMLQFIRKLIRDSIFTPLECEFELRVIMRAWLIDYVFESARARVCLCVFKSACMCVCVFPL